MDDADYIDFMAKYGDWISMRRMAIRPDTRPEEVVFHMAGIRGVIDAKSAPFIGINTAPLDSLAARLTEDKKKGYEGLAQAISGLSGPETKKAVEEACGDKREHAPLAKAYLLGKVLSCMEMDSTINQQALSKIYKNLKIRKPLGRGKKSD